MSDWDEFLAVAKYAVDKKELKSWDSLRLVDVDNMTGYYGWLWSKKVRSSWRNSYSNAEKVRMIRNAIPAGHFK